MFPLNWNIPFIRKNGSRTTLGAITGDIAGIEEDVTDLTEKTDGLFDNMMENGAVNLLPNGATTQVKNGVTFTVNDDGSITANGTASSTTYVDLVTSRPFLERGNYVVSGGVDTNKFIYVNTLNDGTNIGTIARAEGENAVFSINYNGYNQLTVGICITSGQSVDHVTFYPMIRLASITDDTYVPYAMTNRELTEEKLSLSDLKTVVAASSDFADFKTKVAAL